MQILIASSNPGKIIEIAECLGGFGMEVISLSDLSRDIPQPEETGETFRENALQKARYYFAETGCPTVADDSGIVVEALADELGVHTRRWGAGPTASDAEWISFFLDRMSHEPTKRARFVCVLAFIDAQGVEHVFEGTCDGIITEGLEAEYLPGLPISACFRPDGFDRVYCAMSVEEKNRISHRGRACAQLRRFLAGGESGG
jgi:XTP/dITP diphosphohydrolase